jgi:hypothetical protein
MYFGWFVLIFIVWAWFVGGAIYGWRERKLSLLFGLGSVAASTVVALAVVLFVLPYWQVVYLVLLQPG